MAKRLPEDALTTADVEALLRACARCAPTGIRNAALITVLWRSGLRLGEALALRPHDVDFNGGTVVVQSGKGGKRRVVGLDAGARALVADWLRVRSKRVRARSSPLFCTLDGGVIAQSYVRHLLPRLARRGSAWSKRCFTAFTASEMPETLLVRAGLLGRRQVNVAVEDVAEVIPRETRIVLSRSRPRA